MLLDRKSEVTKLEIHYAPGKARHMKCNNILEAMCNTPLIRLNRVGKGFAGQIYVKADYLNPGGSVKDRYRPVDD